MSTRVNHHKATPALAKALSDLSMAVSQTSIDPALKHLIDIRVSQLNGCTFCLDMHAKEAKIAGERELRLYHLAAWRESPLFSAREKAALAFAEALTQIGARDQRCPLPQRGGTLLGKGDFRAELCHCGDQRLEPLRHHLPYGTGLPRRCLRPQQG